MFNPNVENLHKWNGKTFHIVDYDLQDVHPQQNISVTQRITYDTLNQVFSWTYFFQTKNAKGKVVTLGTYDGNCRYIWKNEFELLLKLAGFEKWTVFGGFNLEKLSESSKEMVWVIQK